MHSATDNNIINRACSVTGANHDVIESDDNERDAQGPPLMPIIASKFGAAAAHAIGYAIHCSRSYDVLIGVYDAAGNVI